jgi:anti-anti-sigma factor
MQHPPLPFSLPAVPANESSRRALYLDLSGIDNPTAAGLGELVALHKRLVASGGRLVLCNVSERAYEVFEVARLTQVLDVRRPAGR